MCIRDRAGDVDEQGAGDGLPRGDDDDGHPRGVRVGEQALACLLYTSPSPRDRTRSRMPSSA